MFKQSKPIIIFWTKPAPIHKHHHPKESKKVKFGVTDVMYDVLEVIFDVGDVKFDPIPRQI